MATIFTVGHSTRSIEEFIELLSANNVKQLVDIRTVPRSRHNPQFEQMTLERSLENEGIEHLYIKELGGLRSKAENSINLGWRNRSFRNYDDYMQTESFKEGVERLVDIAKRQPTAIMCAEAVPWRCHRSLVGDALLVRGIKVRDIMSVTSTKEHKLTSFAVVSGTTITYPYDKAAEKA